jgi:hypothetical protein
VRRPGAGDDAGYGYDAGDYGPCAAFDDLTAATSGLYIGDVWVTRLRAKLPVAALAQDLVLQASATQGPVFNLHRAPYTPLAGQQGDQGSDGCESDPRSGEAIFDLGLLAVVTVTLVALRRQRRS